MKQKLITADPFKLRIGTRVFDPKENRQGIVSSVRETSYEYIEAFVLWDGEAKEMKAAKTLDAVIIEET